MKKKYIILSMFIIFIMINLWCKGEPGIEFYEMSHDFGDVSQNTTLKHTFLFMNIGNATLIIKKIKTGWGCTGVLLSDKEIPAGSEGEIEVTLKTGRRKGNITKSIYIYTNDPKIEISRLTVSANISSNLIPELMQFDNLFFY